MTQVLKSFSELPAMPTTYIGKRLKRELGGYGSHITSDVGKLLDLADGAAVSHWMNNRNGCSQIMVKHLAFLLGITPNDLADTGKYAMPKSEMHHFDKNEFAQTIIFHSPFLRNKEFMVDVVRRARAHLVENAAQVQVPFNEPAKEPAKAPDKEPAKAPEFRETISGILETAEKFRAKNCIEWVIKPDGSLGAKRVVVEEW